MFPFKSVWLFSGVLVGLSVTALYAQRTPALDQRLKAIMARPEFAHSRFGIEFYSVDSGTAVYMLNEQQLFVPGSTTKLLTEGAALELFGADYRFHTRVYRTGSVRGDTLDGDLVLVASGDPDLSNRVQPNDTLVFENEDHSYGGPDSKGLKGDPLLVIRELARQIAAKGIKKITGHIVIDTTLFPEGEHELGTDVVLSPMVVNDNLVDVIASPGASQGAAVNLAIAPQTSYVKIINKAVTSKAGSKNSLEYKDEVLNGDGTRTVAITGNLALGARPEMMAYRVPEPSRYSRDSYAGNIERMRRFRRYYSTVSEAGLQGARHRLQNGERGCGTRLAPSETRGEGHTQGESKSARQHDSLSAWVPNRKANRQHQPSRFRSRTRFPQESRT